MSFRLYFTEEESQTNLVLHYFVRFLSSQKNLTNVLWILLNYLDLFSHAL